MNFIRFDHPEYLFLLLLIGPMVWLGKRSLATMDATRRWTAIVLRLLLLFVLIALLSGLQIVQNFAGLTVMAVVDRSESVRRFVSPPTSLPQSPVTRDLGPTNTIEAWTQQWLAIASQKREPDDLFAMISFDGQPTVRSMPSPLIDTAGAIGETPSQGTDIAKAIRLAMAMFNPKTSKRIVLVSDGNDTTRQQRDNNQVILDVAKEAAAAGVPIDVLPLHYAVKKEVLIDRVQVPMQVREGQTIAVRVVLRATTPTQGVLHLKHDGFAVDLDPFSQQTGLMIHPSQWTQVFHEKTFSTRDSYVFVREFQVPLPRSGANIFKAIFDPLMADTLAINNTAEAFTLVHGHGRILMVDHVEKGQGAVLTTALRTRGFVIDVISAALFPDSLIALARYDAVIFQNVPAELISPTQQILLQRYVQEMGGGFIMIGGPDSFGAGGWTYSKVDDILPVTCEIPKKMILPVGALILIIDRSGSMAENYANTKHTKQEVANQAAALAIKTLFKNDYVGVICFDTKSHWVAPLKQKKDLPKVTEKTLGIKTAGGTSIYPALDAAYQAISKLSRMKVGTKHVLLLTDGYSAPGQWKKIMILFRQSGVSLSTVGIGSSFDRKLLAQLAHDGKGKFYPIQNPKHLPQVFIKEARYVRRNLIREANFRPRLQAGSPITKGLKKVPVLRGLVLTGQKKGAFTPMIGVENEPVFAHWQVGLGRTAAFTSDATPRWGSYWVRWPNYSNFWAKTMRSLARPTASRDFELAVISENDQINIKLDASSLDEKAPKLKSIMGVVLAPNGDSHQIKLEQVGPDLFEASLAASKSGSYIVSLITEDQLGHRQFVFGGVTRAASVELRALTSRDGVLEKVAKITGGRILDPAKVPSDLLFKRDATFKPSRMTMPMTWPLLWLSIVIFLFDVASRRLAWDLEMLQNLFQRRPRNENNVAETLSQLKTKKQAILKKESNLSSHAEKTFKLQSFSALDIKEKKMATDDVDIDMAIPKTLAKTHSKNTLTNKPINKQTSSTTSKLLDAKRRARKRYEEGGK